MQRIGRRMSNVWFSVDTSDWIEMRPAVLARQREQLSQRQADAPSIEALPTYSPVESMLRSLMVAE
jgi:hypothetical protein